MQARIDRAPVHPYCGPGTERGTDTTEIPAVSPRGRMRPYQSASPAAHRRERQASPIRRALLGSTMLAGLLGIAAPTAAFAQTTWTGATSNIWQNAGQWTNGVPTAATDATLPGSTPNDPVLIGTGSVNTLTMTGNTLQLNGNTLNATTVDQSAGVIRGASLGDVVNAVTFNLSGSGALFLAPVNATTVNISGGIINSSTVTATDVDISGGAFTSTPSSAPATPSPSILAAPSPSATNSRALRGSTFKAARSRFRAPTPIPAARR